MDPGESVEGRAITVLSALYPLPAQGRMGTPLSPGRPGVRFALAQAVRAGYSARFADTPKPRLPTRTNRHAVGSSCTTASHVSRHARAFTAGAGGGESFFSVHECSSGHRLRLNGTGWGRARPQRSVLPLELVLGPRLVSRTSAGCLRRVYSLPIVPAVVAQRWPSLQRALNLYRGSEDTHCGAVVVVEGSTAQDFSNVTTGCGRGAVAPT